MRKEGRYRMRDKRIEEIKKRIAKRKAQQQREEDGQFFSNEEYEYEPFLVEEGEREVHPLFRKEVFFFKILLSAILVLVVAILFKNTPASMQGAKVTVERVMKEEFQFAAVSNWYEKQFGDPLTFLPSMEKGTQGKEEDYAMPTFGKVTESFKANGQGVFIETEVSATVEAVNEGLVVFAGKKEGYGNTVQIQHTDGSESWYGNLEEVTVNLYDYVDKKQKIGVVANESDEKSGVLYFALKKNEKFIDPIQVISFE